MNAVIDRVVQYPHRYQLKNVGTGEVLGTFDLEPITGTISVVGTKIDKELFDSIASDIADRLVSNGGDLKDTIITFSMASSCSNVASGEKLSVSFGKIAKYFNDLKAVAFSGNKKDIGLSNVDNTSDANKPVSNATQQALNLKANSSDVYTKSESDGLLNDKANKSDVYTKSESDTGLNKSLYNLGYYDTMVDNSDGSYTITRQTGYHNISNDLIEHGYYRTIQGGHGEYGGDTGIHNLPIVSEQKSFINNLLAVRDTKEIYGGSIGIAITSAGGCWMNLGDDYTTKEKYVEYLSQNNIYIQYKLATATTEKVEKNHYSRYNERFILEHNKSEAERSCNLIPTTNSSPMDSAMFDGDTEIPAGTYTLLVTGSGYTSGAAYQLFVNGNSVGAVNVGTKITFTSATAITHIYIYCNNKSSPAILQVMLNEGTEPLPYQPYEGKVVHEERLNAKQDKLVSGENISTINGNSIVGGGNVGIIEGLFELVGKNIDELTITEDGTYFITTTYSGPIYASGKSDIEFYGSAIISTMDMFSDSPCIAINGVAYALPSTTVTLITAGSMNVYKMREE